MTEAYDYLFKCVICGDRGSGKTTLTNQFAPEIYRGDNHLTIGVEFTVKSFEVKGYRTKVQIFDIEDRPRFQYIMPLYFKGAMGAVIVFDLTKQASFDHVPKWYEKVHSNGGYIPIILVGNKNDLAFDQIVFRDEAEVLARDLDMVYVETSTRIGNPIPLFEMLALLMIDEELSIDFLERNHQEKSLPPFGMENRRKIRNQCHFL